MATGSAAKIVSFPVKNPSMAVYSRFWTNFSRQRSRDFEVLDYDPEIPGYWWFDTNLEKDDFDFMLSPVYVRRFLFQMIEIYRRTDPG
jgi:hypothetical protein